MKMTMTIVEEWEEEAVGWYQAVMMILIQKMMVGYDFDDGDDGNGDFNNEDDENGGFD